MGRSGRNSSSRSAGNRRRRRAPAPAPRAPRARPAHRPAHAAQHRAIQHLLRSFHLLYLFTLRLPFIYFTYVVRSLCAGQVARVRAEVEEVCALDRVLAAGFDAGGAGGRPAPGPGAARELPPAQQAPAPAALSGEMEEACNQAMKFLVRALQFCYSAQVPPRTRPFDRSNLRLTGQTRLSPFPPRARMGAGGGGCAAPTHRRRARSAVRSCCCGSGRCTSSWARSTRRRDASRVHTSTTTKAFGSSSRSATGALPPRSPAASVPTPAALARPEWGVAPHSFIRPPPAALLPRPVYHAAPNFVFQK